MHTALMTFVEFVKFIICLKHAVMRPLNKNKWFLKQDGFLNYRYFPFNTKLKSCVDLTLSQVTRTEGLSASYSTVTLELCSEKCFRRTFEHSDYLICIFRGRALDYLKKMWTDTDTATLLYFNSYFQPDFSA